MNIHEYQGKEILKKYGVTIQRGIVADTPDSALQAAKELAAETGTKWFVIKSQIHAGGRGKGKVKRDRLEWSSARQEHERSSREGESDIGRNAGNSSDWSRR